MTDCEERKAAGRQMELYNLPVDEEYQAAYIRRLEQLLRTKSEEIVRLQEKVDLYLHMNSHQIRGPLVQIMGIAELLSNLDLSYGDKELLIHLQVAADRLDRMVRQMNGLLQQNS
ncbi:MAG: hypothetical protein P8X57_03280 [Cyclobacteriaceae bacterium]